MNSIDNLCVNALRVVGAEMITKAKSGHPGIVLGAAPIAHTLFTRHLNINPEDEKWFNRDRFILSAGHGSTLLYEMLHLSGFDLSMEDLKEFRQKGSKTPGHPEYGHVKGVEITTGPLGQGIASSVGFAIAENFLAAKFNKPNVNVIDHYTYVLCGDGDLQEGISMEAASLAGHLNLKKLIVLYDSNDVQLDGDVNQTNTENTKQKFESMNWNYLRVEDGNNCDAIDAAINSAKSSNKPTIIEIKTVIGFGAPNSGESSVHGKPMPEDDIKALRKNLQYSGPVLEYPEDVYNFYKENVIDRGSEKATDWNDLLNEYKFEFSEDYEELEKFMFNDFKLPSFDDMPKYEVGSSESTRKEMGKYIDYLSSKLPNIIGGSADLSSSTMVKGADGIYGPSNPLGRNLKFGVREHAMAAIINGITLHGGLRGFCAGFFVFSDYLKPAVRLAAIMNLPSVFLFSHDTICVGEDGPTHQPVEQLTMFRSMPNTNLIRPADATEMAEAMLLAFDNNTYPTVVTSSRQGLPNLEDTNAEGVKKGAYVVYKSKKNAKVTLISCGSELSITLEAAKKLEKEEKIYCDVVSMPSMFLFDKQSAEYKEEVLPKKNTKIAIELGATMPWYKYADEVYGLDEFGASMPIAYIHETYKFRASDIVSMVLKTLNK
ncbi:MAG: transketolase [Acholeplasmatales bacterium]|nr:transketolase [Acholeplasmatales bacterium]